MSFSAAFLARKLSAVQNRLTQPATRSEVNGVHDVLHSSTDYINRKVDGLHNRWARSVQLDLAPPSLSDLDPDLLSVSERQALLYRAAVLTRAQNVMAAEMAERQREDEETSSAMIFAGILASIHAAPLRSVHAATSSRSDAVGRLRDSAALYARACEALGNLEDGDSDMMPWVEDRVRALRALWAESGTDPADGGDEEGGTAEEGAAHSVVRRSAAAQATAALHASLLALAHAERLDLL